MKKVSDTNDCSIDELKRLLRKGNRLRGLPESSSMYGASEDSGLAVPIAMQKDLWICNTARRICSLLPRTILELDFKEVVVIDEGCVGGKQVDTGSRRKEFEVVAEALGACINFFEWLLNFDEKVLDPQQKAEFWFLPLEAMVLNVEKKLITALPDLEDGRTRKTALLHLYGRVFQLARSILKLNDLKCCQLLIAALRGMLELYVDMALIKGNMIDKNIEKFFTFYESYKYRTAINLKRIDEEIERPGDESPELNKYVEKAKEIKGRVKVLWGRHAKPNKLQHWTWLSLEERARKVGKLKIYREVYYYGNMYVHSGYVDFPRTSADAHLMCSYAYSFAAEMFKEALELVLGEIELTVKEEILRESELIGVFFGYFRFWKASFVVRKDGEKVPGPSINSPKIP